MKFLRLFNHKVRLLLELRTPEQQVEPLRNWTPSGTYAIDLDMFAALSSVVDGDVWMRYWIGETKHTRQKGSMSAKFLMTSPNQVIKYPQAQFRALQALVSSLRLSGASVQCPLYIRDNYWLVEPEQPHILQADISKLDLSRTCEPEFRDEATSYFEIPKKEFKFLTYKMQQKEYLDWWNGT